MANGQTQAPQYPAPIAPSFQSFAQRQRMAIDDAIAAQEAQEERVGGVAKAGAKAGFEYDKMLRGYMEAKYANPNLTFWEYATKPSVGGAFQAEGRRKIAAHISAGGDIKDIPGMSFGERQKAGIRGILGADKPEPSVQSVADKTIEPVSDKPPLGKRIFGKHYDREAQNIAPKVRKSFLEGEFYDKEAQDLAGKVRKSMGKDKKPAVEAVVPDVVPPVVKDVVPDVTDVVPDVQPDDLGALDPAKLLSKSPEATKTTEQSLGTIAKLMDKPDAAAALIKTEPSVIERTAKGVDITGGQYSKVPEITKPAVDVDPVAVWGEPAKGGLKETLGKAGKVGKGLGYGVSAVSGVQRLAKGETGEERLGGAVQAAGGVAGLVAMTNFWNPVGWAAAIPAALSIGGGLMGGGGNDALSKTPLGRYRRRVGIG